MSDPGPRGVTPRVQLDMGGKPFLAPDRVDLLEAIAETGSITHAAQRVGLSYKAAWDAIEALHRRAGCALVERAAGGVRGGGSRLTEYGQGLVTMVRRLERDSMALVAAPEGARSRVEPLVARLPLRTSARNQWLATVAEVQRAKVSTSVRVLLAPDVSCVAQISTDSADSLGLRPGVSVCALVKATAVTVEPEGRARQADTPNRLRGVVREKTRSEAHTALRIEVAPDCMVSAVVPRRARERTLAVGSAAYVSFPPHGVVLMLAP